MYRQERNTARCCQYLESKRKETTSETNRLLLASLKAEIPIDLSAKFTPVLESYGIKEDVAADPNVQVVRIKAIREEMNLM